MDQEELGRGRLTYVWLVGSSQGVLLLLGCCQLLHCQCIGPLEQLWGEHKQPLNG